MLPDNTIHWLRAMKAKPEMPMMDMGSILWSVYLRRHFSNGHVEFRLALSLTSLWSTPSDQFPTPLGLRQRHPEPLNVIVRSCHVLVGSTQTNLNVRCWYLRATSGLKTRFSCAPMPNDSSCVPMPNELSSWYDIAVLAKPPHRILKIWADWVNLKVLGRDITIQINQYN